MDRDSAALTSFLEIPEESPFPLQNLPYGAFRRSSGDENVRIGVRLGDFVIDLAALEEAGLFRRLDALRGRFVFDEPVLNPFLALGRAAWSQVRERLMDLLSGASADLRDSDELRSRAVIPLADVELHLPVHVGDYTDFYSSKHHATNVGTMFRGAENALMPNYLHLPVAYHGRASSVVLSGRDVHRPVGQTRPDDDAPPVFGPSKLLDYELEMGFITGPGNELGRPIPIEETEEHIFGFVLVNDWSARDIQKWEYQPLGPFNAKNFATSISPWVVTLEALAPFKVAPPEQEPAPLPYLQEATPWSLDIPIDILLESEEMEQPHPVARSNFRHLYWTPAQQLAHHTVTGCNIRPGDLLASGTISGPEKSTRGCLLELTWKGSEPVRLPNGETRTFLKDGDRVTFRATCEKEGLRIGFGEVTGRVLPPIGE